MPKWSGEFWNFNAKGGPGTAKNPFEWIFDKPIKKEEAKKKKTSDRKYTILISSPYLDGSNYCFNCLDELLESVKSTAVVFVLTNQEKVSLSITNLEKRQYKNIKGIVVNNVKSHLKILGSHSKIYCIFSGGLNLKDAWPDISGGKVLLNLHIFPNTQKSHVRGGSKDSKTGKWNCEVELKPIIGAFGSVNFTKNGMFVLQDELVTISNRKKGVKELARAFASRWSVATKNGGISSGSQIYWF